MLTFMRTTLKVPTVTEYEDSELAYAINQMEESFWNNQSTNQGIVDDKNMRIYVMVDNSSFIESHPDYEVVNVNED